ncbi:6-phosphogluconolactonase [Oceanicoccus sp. KOV_DT_Chl]|uniref:6-phosphogluconolactonase n=1 Tax=Oceanicoccus sp. KOV_DT_Chl TaxID=1904639 RepID=UPI000C7D3542|nr:6-phosphogluconolactonase [Oceanicoccus sp. KOV_DT_Chl]
MITENFFTSRDDMFAALLADCQQILQRAIEQRQTATLLVSGGSTPKPLYQQLSAVDLDWQKVSVALVDERWVDARHAGSNEAFIIQNLLQQHAALAKFIPMKNIEATAKLGLSLCEQRYQQLQKPFDLTILGMGPDSHTASLFPHADGLVQGLDRSDNNLCVAIEANPSAVTGELTERMSMSLYGLLQSRQLHLLITGEEKMDVYQQALLSDDVLKTPISAVLQQHNVPVHVYWAP